MHRLRATYGTPGGAMVAEFGLILAGAVLARTVLTAIAHFRAAAGGRRCGTRRPLGLSGGPSRPWGPCWWNTPSRLPTASPAGSPQ